MKLRKNQLIAVVVTLGDEGFGWGRDMREMQPIIVAGGPVAEHNRQAILDNIVRITGESNWTARIAYRWRSKRHLMRSIKQGNKWRKRKRR